MARPKSKKCYLSIDFFFLLLYIINVNNKERTRKCQKKKFGKKKKLKTC